jgi:hypothetical protein
MNRRRISSLCRRRTFFRRPSRPVIPGGNPASHDVIGDLIVTAMSLPLPPRFIGGSIIPPNKEP